MVNGQAGKINPKFREFNYGLSSGKVCLITDAGRRQFHYNKSNEMREHAILLTIFLVAATAISLFFFFIYRSSLPEDGKGMVNAGKKRLFFALILASVLIILLTVTLPKSPYFLFADETPAKVVYVAARQYSYTMSYQAIDPKSAGRSDVIELPVNQPVEFRVTSFDVNHGFSIYNDRAELVTQTQAMPGYVNRLRWVFTEPGTYNVLCLEYCGVGHPIMRTSFTVK